MKKYSRGMASFVVMMMLSPVAAQAADGKVTFNGEVIENTCTVVNKDKTVTLPTVQRSALSSAGETAGVVPFTIDLTSCTPGADVSVYFEKDQYVSTEGRLKNTLSDGTEAENVDVELLNTRFTPINLAETPAVAARRNHPAQPPPPGSRPGEQWFRLAAFLCPLLCDRRRYGWKSRYLRQLYGGLSVTPVHGPVQGPFIHPARRR